MMDESDHTNQNRMKHLLLSVITVESKYFALLEACLENMLIHFNQSITKIDRRRHSAWNISLGSKNSCTEMKIFRSSRNSNDGIPPINIRSISPVLPGRGYSTSSTPPRGCRIYPTVERRGMVQR